MKIDLANTYIGVSSNVKDHAKGARKFLLDNVHQITFPPDEEQKLLNTHDSMTHTIMSDLYQQAITEDKLGIFKLLILDKVDKIPSWFLISWLDIDTYELRVTDKHSAEVLNTISEYRDKILVDVTPYYSEKRKTITDVTSFYARMVRGMLCRSYHIADQMWLTPRLIYFLTKFFITIVSSKIGKVYNLTYQEQYVAATALAVFFVNRCTSDEEVVNPMMGKMDFLRRVIDTKPIYDHIVANYNVHTYDMNAVAETIVTFSPARVGNFTASTLYRMNTNLTSNQVISLIALEYPPYWCHLILSAMSGDKTSIYHNIKTLRREIVEFQNEMMKTGSFILSL